MVGGKKVPDEEQAKMFHGLVIKQKTIQYTVELPGFSFDMAYQLRARPESALDLEIVNTGDKSPGQKKAFGIYGIQGNSLKIFYNALTRAADFTAEAGSGNTLIVLKR